MFTKFLMTTVVIGSGLLTGATVSAGDIAQTPPPPPPPPPVATIGGFAAPERPGSAEFTIPCLGSTACDSLAGWCSDHGGTFTDWEDRSGETKGLCSG